MEIRQSKRIPVGRRGSVTRVSSSLDEGPSMEVEMMSVHEAFAQPLLLEMIINYAMREPNGNLSEDNIQNLRLVQKSWKQAVSKVLCEKREPLYNLSLDEDNSLNDSQAVKAEGKLLDNFVDYWTTGKRAKESMPTFRLRIWEEFFVRENYDSLLNSLRKCGGGLVDLELDVPENGGSLPGILSDISLPVLQKLIFRFTGNYLQLENENVEETEVNLFHPANVTFLCQSLLTKAKSLKNLVLTSQSWMDFHSCPGMQYISLPTTLTRIEIRFQGMEHVLELLTRNKLPNLRTLCLSVIYGKLLPAGILFRIFENVGKTLRFLELDGSSYSGPPRVANLIAFPVMEQLKKLELLRAHFELEAEISSMNDLFPKLETLALYDQTPEMFKKWISGSEFISLTTLGFELIDESKAQVASDPSPSLPLSLETIQGAHRRFPNVRSLTVQVPISATVTSGLKYIFSEMRQLTELVIMVVGSDSLVGSDYWDSLLIGAPMEFVVGMKACPQFWSTVKLENNPEPFIGMLKELTSLKLVAVDDDNPESLISDLTFLYGFLKMPNLQSLNFFGRFSASKEMSKVWKEKGCTIEYSSH